jgi:hypothetical protein
MSNGHEDDKSRPAPLDPMTLNEVLRAELDELRSGLLDGLPKTNFKATSQERTQNLREIYLKIGSLPEAPVVPEKSTAPAAPEGSTAPAAPEVSTAPTVPEARRVQRPLVALCLSGGGIRSATFNLGVLQYLAKIGMLSQVDYLSSVSGGGYIAGWLRTWIRRDGLAKVETELGNNTATRDPLHPEPKPVTNLRDYSNYLTPKVGLFSGDTWAAAAIILRNLILNWLVLVPLMAAVIGIPLFFLLLVRSSGIPASWSGMLLRSAIGIEAIASVLVYSFRRFAKNSDTPQGYFILCCVLPICWRPACCPLLRSHSTSPGSRKPLIRVVTTSRACGSSRPFGASESL